METKPFWQSKTLWFNVLAFLWQFFGEKIGVPTLDPEMFGAIIMVVNVILRAITKGTVTIS